MQAITRNQAKVLRLIARSIDQTGIQPSYRDICVRFGWSSPNAVKTTMDSLERLGLIKRRGSRAVEFDWKSYL
jgi:SOS-response transcriptional repressor LexA